MPLTRSCRAPCAVSACWEKSSSNVWAISSIETEFACRRVFRALSLLSTFVTLPRKAARTCTGVAIRKVGKLTCEKVEIILGVSLHITQRRLKIIDVNRVEFRRIPIGNRVRPRRKVKDKD